MGSGFGELITEINEVDQQEAVPLGTAQWMGQAEATSRLAMPADNRSDQVWIGEALDKNAASFGYADDRHVLLVSGTRGGKGAGVIVPNLCNWRGSCYRYRSQRRKRNRFGQAARQQNRLRGGLGQEVRILDPFGGVPPGAARKGRFNRWMS